MFSLEQIETDVLASLRTAVFSAQTVYEEGIPDLDTIHRSPSGDIVPYVTVQLGDLQHWGSTSFTGPRGDDYVLPVYYQVVAPTAGIGRQLRTYGLNRFLGLDFDWAGQIRKRNAGGTFPIKNSDGAVECYIFPSSFGIVVQLAEIPEPDEEP